MRRNPGKPERTIRLMALRLGCALWLFTLGPAAAEDCGAPPESPAAFFGEFNAWMENTKIELDPGLLTDWQTGTRPPCPEPYLATFEKNGRSLAYLAVRHVAPPVQVAGSDLALLERAVKKLKPRELVLEMASDSSLSPGQAAEAARGCRNGSTFLCGEPQFLLEIAATEGLQVHAGEATPPELYGALSRDFPLQDLYALESTRAWWTMKTTPPADDEAGEFLKLVRQGISEAQGPWSLDQFDRWVKKEMGPDLSARDATIQWLEPRNDAAASRLNRISYAADKIRDAKILRLIERSLNQSGHTLVVYGSSHFVREKKALEQALGPAKIQCLRQP